MWQNTLWVVIRRDNLYNTRRFDLQFQISHEILNRFCLRSLVTLHLLRVLPRQDSVQRLFVIRLRSGMRLHMSLHITSYSEWLAAYYARMRLLAGVYATMILQITARAERFVAVLAAIVLFAGVDTPVHDQ